MVVDLAGNVVIVNAGPKPINVQNVFLDRPDFVLRSKNAAGWTGPGQTAEVDVSVKVSCLMEGRHVHPSTLIRGCSYGSACAGHAA
jgi:hypothetical protein